MAAKLNQSKQLFVVAGFLLYAVAWTALLLTPNPVELMKALLLGAEISTQIEATVGPWDKAIHAAGYFLLYVAAALALKTSGSRRGRYNVLFLCAVHGLLTEALQQFCKGRSADPLDWLANVAGAGIGLMILSLVTVFFRKS